MKNLLPLLNGNTNNTFIQITNDAELPADFGSASNPGQRPL